MLSQDNNLDLMNVLSYPLSPVPWALATADNVPNKTDKSKLMHKLEVEPVGFPATNEISAYIIDGNALLQSISNLPTTFGELADRIFFMLPKSKRVDYVSDVYSDISIKAVERKRRGITDEFIVKGPSTRIPKDWKGFLSNNQNKTILTKLLLELWKLPKYANSLQNRQLYFVSDEECFCLTSTDGLTTECVKVEELCSSQEEADTRIILHCFHASTNSSSGNIIVRSPDTDVFILLLYYAVEFSPNHTLLMDTGLGNKRRIINMSHVLENCGREKSIALPSLHAFSGCDTVSSFTRKGKITVLKILNKYPEFASSFSQLGSSLDIQSRLFSELETFVCRLYGNSTCNEVNKLRYEMAMQRGFKSGLDLSLLPPCKASLDMHIKRANYQSFIWKKAHIGFVSMPLPMAHGWQMKDNELECTWSEDDNILPQELVDLLGKKENVDTDDDAAEDDVEIDGIDQDLFFDDDEY